MSDRLAAWVAAYDRQGWHRTGSPTDARSAAWLAHAAAGLGAQARLRPWPLTRLVHRSSALVTPLGRVPGTPCFDAPLPAGGSVSGAVGELGSAAAIAVCDLAGAGVAARLRAARRGSEHRAIVCVSAADDGSLRLANAPGALDPAGPAVLQVAGRHRPRLAAAVAAGAGGTVSVDAVRRPARAFNVEVDCAAGSPSVVVLTPRSGWWQCAAERGGGLACWLAALQRCVGGGGAPVVRFIATSGHELGYLGVRAYLDGVGALRDVVWLHLGANLGAAGGRVRCWASDPELFSVAAEAFAAAGAGPLPAREHPVGESTVLHERGLRCVSLVGDNAHFHTARDRFPDNVDLGALRRLARAVGELVVRLGDV